MRRMKSLSIFLLLIFGLCYSAYLAFAGSVFLGFVFSLISVGLTSTIYILDRRLNSRIIVYIWLAIIVVVVSAYISTGVFNLANVFRNPVKYV
jgi:hypothetical protein